MSLPRPIYLLLAGAGILTLALLLMLFLTVPMACSWGASDIPTCVRIEPLATILAAGLWLGVVLGAALIGLGVVRGQMRR